jgi:NitT/TauT family transport system ATP-binding protein
MGRRRQAERVGFFPLFLLQSAPPLFWVTPLVLWLGTRGHVALAVAFLVSLPLLTVHTLAAIKHIPACEYDLFSIYAPRTRVMISELYLPRLLPAVKSNVHLGVLVAIKAAMLAEWFAAQDGFGRTIRIHYQFFAMTEFVGWAFLFLLVIGGVSFGLQAVLKRALPAYRRTVVPESRPGTTPQIGTGSLASANGDATPVSGNADARQPRLAVRDLAFGYEREPLFSGLSFTVGPERPLVLSGESGCGKTTLLRCVAGITRPWSGRVERPGRVGLVFQEDALLAHRDALGNVLLPSLPRFDRDDVDRARSCLELWGLGGCEELFPHELSGGMRKRLAMARVWFLRPAALLLDEPFVNLDREARSALWRILFDRLGETRLPAVIVTHYPEELAEFEADTRPWPSLANRPSGNPGGGCYPR